MRTMRATHSGMCAHARRDVDETLTRLQRDVYETATRRRQRVLRQGPLRHCIQVRFDNLSLQDNDLIRDVNETLTASACTSLVRGHQLVQCVYAHSDYCTRRGPGEEPRGPGYDPAFPFNA